MNYLLVVIWTEIWTSVRFSFFFIPKPQFRFQFSSFKKIIENWKSKLRFRFFALVYKYIICLQNINLKKMKNRKLIGFKKKSVRFLTFRFGFSGLKPNRRHHYLLYKTTLDKLQYWYSLNCVSFYLDACCFWSRAQGNWWRVIRRHRSKGVLQWSWRKVCLLYYLRICYTYM